MKNDIGSTLVNETDLSRLTGKSRDFIRRRVGSISAQDGRYRLAEALQAIVANDQGAVTLNDARTRSEIAKAEKTEIEVETMRKERIPVEDALRCSELFFRVVVDEIERSALSIDAQNEIRNAICESIKAVKLMGPQDDG